MAPRRIIQLSHTSMLDPLLAPRAAKQLSRFGRNGDSELAHINHQEQTLLDGLQGGRSINPTTGLPEYFKLGGVLKNVLRVGGALVGGMLGGPTGAAIGAGLTTGLTGGSVGQSLGAAALGGLGQWGLEQTGFSGLGGATDAVRGGVSSGLSSLGLDSLAANIGGPTAAQAATSMNGTGLPVNNISPTAAVAAGAAAGAPQSLLAKYGPAALTAGTLALAGGASNSGQQQQAQTTGSTAAQPYTYKNYAPFPAQTVLPYAGNASTYAQTGGEHKYFTTVNPQAQPMARGGRVQGVSALAAMGQRGDDRLAYLGPNAQALLRARGGVGSLNPRTGLPQYYDGGDPSGNDSGTGMGGAADARAGENNGGAGEVGPSEASFVNTGAPNPDDSPGIFSSLSISPAKAVIGALTAATPIGALVGLATMGVGALNNAGVPSSPASQTNGEGGSDLQGAAAQGFRMGQDMAHQLRGAPNVPTRPNVPTADQRRGNNATPYAYPDLRFAAGGPARGLGALSLAEGPVRGPGGGQDDLINARLADGEHVLDADTVAALGDGSNDEGHRKLEQFKRRLRKQKRAAPVTGIPPKAKPIERYLGGKV